MSTGQRWRSCMARDGINYKYVVEDIKAGSLVAYVVLKDDVKALYPLMRVLIKPFRNDKGETILVPANIYGGFGAGNSRTRDAVQQTLLNFVAAQNANKSGEFHMDSHLYADGQAQVARLQGAWTKEGTQEALRKYQEGSIQEWIVEIKTNTELLKYGKRDEHGAEPADNIEKLKSKIRNVLNAKDEDIGLPRMFFREMLRSSVGSTPSPQEILHAVKEDPYLNNKSDAFTALVQINESKWKVDKKQSQLKKG